MRKKLILLLISISLMTGCSNSQGSNTSIQSSVKTTVSEISTETAAITTSDVLKSELIQTSSLEEAHETTKATTTANVDEINNETCDAEQPENHTYEFVGLGKENVKAEVATTNDNIYMKQITLPDYACVTKSSGVFYASEKEPQFYINGYYDGEEVYDGHFRGSHLDDDGFYTINLGDNASGMEVTEATMGYTHYKRGDEDVYEPDYAALKLNGKTTLQGINISSKSIEEYNYYGTNSGFVFYPYPQSLIDNGFPVVASYGVDVYLNRATDGEFNFYGDTFAIDLTCENIDLKEYFNDCCYEFVELDFTYIWQSVHYEEHSHSVFGSFNGIRKL